MANNEVREEIEEIGRKTDVNKEKVVKQRDYCKVN